MTKNSLNLSHGHHTLANFARFLPTFAFFFCECPFSMKWLIKLLILHHLQVFLPLENPPNVHKRKNSRCIVFQGPCEPSNIVPSILHHSKYLLLPPLLAQINYALSNNTSPHQNAWHHFLNNESLESFNHFICLTVKIY